MARQREAIGCSSRKQHKEFHSCHSRTFELLNTDAPDYNRAGQRGSVSFRAGFYGSAFLLMSEESKTLIWRRVLKPSRS